MKAIIDANLSPIKWNDDGDFKFKVQPIANTVSKDFYNGKEAEDSFSDIINFPIPTSKSPTKQTTSDGPTSKYNP